MSDPIFIILVFAGVVLITAVLFFGWLVLITVRLLFRGVRAVFRGLMMPMCCAPPPVRSSLQCRRSGCLAHNPPNARFCRRCGQSLEQPQPAVVRRAAVW